MSQPADSFGKFVTQLLLCASRPCCMNMTRVCVHRNVRIKKSSFKIPQNNLKKILKRFLKQMHANILSDRSILSRLLTFSIWNTLYGDQVSVAGGDCMIFASVSPMFNNAQLYSFPIFSIFFFILPYPRTLPGPSDAAAFANHSHTQRQNMR